jgi:hypothetical protein
VLQNNEGNKSILGKRWKPETLAVCLKQIIAELFHRPRHENRIWLRETQVQQLNSVGVV